MCINTRCDVWWWWKKWWWSVVVVLSAIAVAVAANFGLTSELGIACFTRSRGAVCCSVRSLYTPVTGSFKVSLYPKEFSVLLSSSLQWVILSPSLSVSLSVCLPLSLFHTVPSCVDVRKTNQELGKIVLFAALNSLSTRGKGVLQSFR